MAEMTRQSVRVGDDQLCFALITADTSAGITYDEIDVIPGISQVGITRSSSMITIYNDDKPQEQINQDGTTSVSFKLSGLSSKLKAKYLGGTYQGGLYTEGWGSQTPSFALGWRSQMSNGNYMYFWFYKGSLSKPNVASVSKTASVAAQTDSFVYTAIEPIYEIGENNLLKTFKSDDADSGIIGLTDELLNDKSTGWFSTPLYIPAAPGTALTDLAGATGSANQINLSFTAPVSADSVVAQVSTLGGWVNATEVSSTSSTIVIGGLTTGNSYSVRLAVTGGTNNGFSNTATATAG